MTIRPRLGLLAAASLTVAIAIGAPAASAVEPARRVPVPVAAVSGLPSPRLDQDTTQTVVASGASREAVVSVSWGDGLVSRQRPACTAVRATKRPAACTVSFTHPFQRTGSYPIVVKSGARTIARTLIVVREAPRPWSPPAGWVQPAGWRFFGGSATYVPCSTVKWFYDRSAEPTGAVGMRAEIEGALARLAVETGLTFTETTDPAAAGLTFDWDDLLGEYADAAGVGGRSRGEGFVTFSSTHWWPSDQWPGYGVVHQPDGSYAIGRGWLVVHETMHALGMDHVEDPTAIMNPQAGATALNAGDLDGLRTMYLSNPCPA